MAIITNSITDNNRLPSNYALLDHDIQLYVDAFKLNLEFSYKTDSQTPGYIKTKKAFGQLDDFIMYLSRHHKKGDDDVLLHYIQIELLTYIVNDLRNFDPLLPEPESRSPDDDYAAEYLRVAGKTHELREEAAAALTPKLNAKIQGMERDTLEQMKALANWVNDQLEPLGLAVQCPKTGEPAKLKAIAGGYRPGINGTYCFEYYKAGKRLRPAYSDALPKLTLIDSNPASVVSPNLPNETEASWQESVASKNAGHGRVVE